MKLPKELLQKRSELGDSSFYIYDESLISKNIEKFKSVPYLKTTIYFASMANDNPILLKKLQQTGMGIFVNSRKHLQLGLDCGFTAEKIIFASTGVSNINMELIIDKGIHLNIDSKDQLVQYGELNPGGSIGIRLNIDEKSKNNIFSGMESRIGVLESELDDIFAIAGRYQLNITGTHVYLGTDVTSLNDLLESVDKTLILSDRFDNLQFIDFGGGFPLEEERFDFEQYKNEISQRMTIYSQKRGRGIDLILEPGRAMFGNTAFFLAQVTDVKERPDRYLVCANASASLIPRAMFYEDYNPVEPINKDETEMFDKKVDIVGSTTYSRDFMGKSLKMPRVKVGDWLQFKYAGSYCYSMITRFLGQTIPSEFLLKTDGTVETIREGESFFENAM